MNGTSTLTPMAQMTVNKMTGDMRFVGVFYIIMGALYCLSIIGAVIGIPLIICGLRIRESADAYNGYLGSNDVNMLERAFERQGSFFFIQKVLMIIGLVFIVLYIIFIIAFGAAIFSAMGGNYPSY
ncbi:MAG: hypothetical protein A2V93_06420 [Ignavibacteria bacterium RBG_16_34_14]|nr:MAG: hypothetical protein A2V93_06420 [Ignavibacteria bacterium RBG_16_34_14]